MGFWSINPYVGCEFGCTYCYARDTHRWTVERAGGAAGGSGDEPCRPGSPSRSGSWSRQDIAERLARTLDPSKLGRDSLVIGTATDPYQPAERRYRLTRSILEVLTRYRGLRIGIISKSPLVTRDIDVLQQLTARHEVTVNVSLSTLDARLARRLELRSPVPSARIRGLRRLGAAGIYAGLLIAPIVPGRHRRRGGARPADGGGEGGGCPLRDRVGAPARPRGAAPLPSPHRPRVSRPRRALPAALRQPRGREPRVPRGAEPAPRPAPARARVSARRRAARRAAARRAPQNSSAAPEQPALL